MEEAAYRCFDLARTDLAQIVQPISNYLKSVLKKIRSRQAHKRLSLVLLGGSTLNLRVLRELFTDVVALLQVIMQDGKTLVALKDGTKFTVPGSAVQKGGGVTVLKINNKQQATDHSYTFVCELRGHEDDEGYNSRSSMDSEGEDHAAPSPGGSDSALGSPNPTDASGGADVPSPVASAAVTLSSGPLSPKINGTGNKTSSPSVSTAVTKPAKIVIVKRDAPSAKQEMSPKQLEDCKLMPSPLTNGNSKSLVLRTLLKQKPVRNVLPPPSNHVVPVQLETDGSAGSVEMESVQRSEEGTEAMEVNECLDQEIAGKGDTTPETPEILTDNVIQRPADEVVEAPDKEEEEEAAAEQNSESLCAVETNVLEEGNTGENTVVMTPEQTEAPLNSDQQNCESYMVCEAEEVEQMSRDPEVSEGGSCEIAATALDREVTEITADMSEVAAQTVDASDGASTSDANRTCALQEEGATHQEGQITVTDSTLLGEVTESGSEQGIAGGETSEVGGQGETIHITNTEETDCVSVGSPEVASTDGVASPLGVAAPPQPATTTVQLLVTTSPPKAAATGLTQLTGLLQGGQQSKVTTKVRFETRTRTQ